MYIFFPYVTILKHQTIEYIFTKLYILILSIHIKIKLHACTSNLTKNYFLANLYHIYKLYLSYIFLNLRSI